MNNNIGQKRRSLVAANKLEIALDELLNLAASKNDQEMQDKITNLKFRYKGVKQKERIGIIGFSETLNQQAFIANSALEMLNELEIKPIQSQDNNKQSENKAQVRTILFLASSPSDEAKLQLEKEFVRIHRGLQNGNIEYKLVSEWAVNPNKLQAAIFKHQPNIIHVSGHGVGVPSEDENQRAVGFENLEEEDGIILQNSKGEGQFVLGEALENMFRIFSKKIKIEIVLLNACYSKKQADGIKNHVNFVIGMKDEIDDDAAIEFSTGFYRSLSYEDDIEFAFDLAVNAIQLEGLFDENVPVLLRKESN